MVAKVLRESQHNDIQQNDIQHFKGLVNDTQNNVVQLKGLVYDTQHNDTQHTGLVHDTQLK